MAGLYIHIPFCASKCIYCDFYSVANKRNLIDTYIDAVVKEFVLRINELSSSIETIYIGGGTPSLLNITQFNRLVNGIREYLNFSKVKEFTVEMNPDDVRLDYIISLNKLGVNRVSMGVQSFNDNELQFINRRHNSKQAKMAVDIIHKGGIDNISIDLIYGIPGQTIETWKQSINEVLSLPVSHISAYSMMYEKGTRLWVMRELGEIEEVDDDTCIEMYDYLINEMKQKGFQHYEVSNFSIKEKQSLHNSNYWNLTPYLGLGAAAHSFDGITRRYNPNSLKHYLHSLQEGHSAFSVEIMEEWERYDEYVMLRMRTSNGLCFETLKNKFSSIYIEHFIHKASKLVAAGKLKEANGNYIIPEQHEMLLDEITRELMWDI